MKNALSLGILLLFANVLAGCGPKEGRAVSRQFTPAHSFTFTYFNSVHSGKSEILIPMHLTIDVPARWEITITRDGTNFVTWKCSESDFNQATNGAWFRKGVGIIPAPRQKTFYTNFTN